MEGTKPPWWAPLVAQLVKNLPAMRETWFDLWVGKTPWRRERLPTPVFWPEEFHGLCSPWGHKESDTTEWLSLSLSEFYTAFTCLPTSWFAVKMLLFLLRRSSFPSFLLTFGLPSGSDEKKNLSAMLEIQVRSLGQEDHLEKEMATHSNILGWRIPWTEKPGGL